MPWKRVRGGSESDRSPNRNSPIYLGNSPPFSPSILSPLPSPPLFPASSSLSTAPPTRYTVALYPPPWPLQPTYLRTQRTRMPSPRSSSPTTPARSSAHVLTSSVSQSSRSASPGVCSLAIGRSPGQSALPIDSGAS